MPKGRPLPVPPMSFESFLRLLADQGFHCRRIDGQWMIDGIRLRTPEDEKQQPEKGEA